MAITISRPTVNGSNNSWGDTINTGLQAIESTLNGTGTGKVTVAPDLDTLTINGTDVTATAAELNIMDGVTATATEINLLDGGKSSGWAINANGTTLEFKYNGTVRFKMTSTGTFQADDDVQAVAF
jgi:hypothetical protein